MHAGGRAHALRAMRFAFLIAFFLPFLPSPPLAALAAFLADFLAALAGEAAVALLLVGAALAAAQKVHALHLQTAGAQGARGGVSAGEWRDCALRLLAYICSGWWLSPVCKSCRTPRTRSHP